MGSGYAVRWEDRRLPHRLIGKNGEYLGSTSACSANCEIVFGNNTWARIDDSLGVEILRDASFEAWYWKANGESGRIGAPNNDTVPTQANPKGWSFRLSSASADGGLLVGWYQSQEMQATPYAPNWADGLIWSQDTGYVTVSGLLNEIGHTLDWYSIRAADISSNGRYILLTSDEVHALGTDPTSSSHAALLMLTPKQR